MWRIGDIEILENPRKIGSKSSYDSLTKLADSWFSKYVRVRDCAPATGICSCCTCGRYHHVKDIDCGHWRKRNKLMTRWDHRNCHAQCTACNDHGKGMETEHQEYIRIHYGQKVVNELIILSGMRGVKFYINQLHDIAYTFRVAAQHMASQKGIAIW